ncbi:glycoside hydrolase family 4 [Saliphagus infecundisoli]|uniref:Glycoside hydrolase family 4 n=1 Tax=Saliphagus infecundisoli TaxID=1849069 RepID=A0ABD5QK83_9EURY|nr:glycoside hydrolase family 4 [Saliphagus infecundisoli]
MHELRREQPVEPERVRIGYVGGGSRSWAATLMNDLAQCTDLAGEVVLYDVDHESARANAELGEWIQSHDDAVGDWSYEVVESLAAALSGADFVICSTQDPPAETMAKDLELPAEYGIHQTVGDTVGPGGTMRAMRAVPQYREIAATVREECPDAWVINYTNPMTVCTRTLYAEYPDINAVGLCHEVFKVQELFADLVEDHVKGAEDVSREEIDVTVKGVNHFTWVDEAHWRDRDLYGLLETWLDARKPVPRFDSGELSEASYFVNHRDVTQDLYRQFEILPAAGDRHLVEFVPWYLSVDEPEEVHRWGIRRTPSEYRVDHWGEGEHERRDYLEGDDPFEFTESGEEAVDWMRALRGLEPLKTHANYPNVGQCPDLAEGAVVETNVLVDGGGVTPQTAGSFPPELRTVLTTHVTNQETIVEAGMEGDVDRAYRAFLNDPLVTIDTADARELFSRLIEAEREYLDDWDLKASRILPEGPTPAVADD